MGANASLIRNTKTSRSKKNSKPDEVVEINDKECLRPVGYRLQKTIGEGSYGKVKLAYSKTHRREVAIKIVNPAEAKQDFKTCFLQREKHVSYVAKHPNIVRCFDILECGPKVYMIFEYLENGDLCSYIKRKKLIELSLARSIFQGLVNAVTYLHENNVAHRDLKLENILLTKELVPKLSDFGFAKKVRYASHKSNTFCGSQIYSSLEVLAGIPYDIFKADIWSLGVILFAIVTGHFPFHEDRQLHVMREGVSFRGVPQYIPLELAELIRTMLETNPVKRPSIIGVRNNKWTGLNDHRDKVLNHDKSQILKAKLPAKPWHW